MRTGLVLGAGGIVGGSWLVGALEALESETGWRAADADVIVGTSAGSVVGALTAAGLSPALMAAYIGGGQVDELAEMEERGELMVDRADETAFRLHPALPPVGPGSWRMALTTLANPLRHSPTAVLSGWLPRGFVSTVPIRGLVERFVSGQWPDHPAFWAVAADYRTGRRVAFGRDDAPPATVGEAVAASCAIPGFYHPVGIGGRRYVDGGICSPSNLDLVERCDLDHVVCLNPMSSLAEGPGGGPVERVCGALRRMTGRRLGHEARKLRERGVAVTVLQPTAEDLAVMGANLMARDRREEVIEQAMASTARQLRRRRDRPSSRLPAPARSRRPTRSRERKAA